MNKKPSSQILAENLDRLMAAHPDLGSNHALGIKAKVAHSHIRRIRMQESAATVDVLDKLATAFGIHPFELLTDGEEFRNAVMQKLIWGRTPSNHEVEDQIPMPKEVAAKRRKKVQRGARDERA